MERKIINSFLKWKDKKNRKPLLVTGVRQCGKTYLIKSFGEEEFEDTAYFNFDENEEYKQFLETTTDVNRILQNLILVTIYLMTVGKR